VVDEARRRYVEPAWGSRDRRNAAGQSTDSVAEMLRRSTPFNRITKVGCGAEKRSFSPVSGQHVCPVRKSYYSRSGHF
jgi:hypothetical protein